MRTELTVLRQMASALFGSSRRYRVKGLIEFEVHSLELGRDYLKAAVLEANAAFPWRDVCTEPEEHDFNGGNPVFFLTEKAAEVNTTPCPASGMYVVGFYIHHSQRHVRKGQVYGYEQYLAKLVQELTEKRLPHVVEVWGVIEMKATILAPH